MWMAHAAIITYMAAEQGYLEGLPPDERRRVLRERRLERAPEVQLARAAIAAEGLRSPYAEQLLEEARRLAES